MTACSEHRLYSVLCRRVKTSSWWRIMMKMILARVRQNTATDETENHLLVYSFAHKDYGRCFLCGKLWSRFVLLVTFIAKS